MIVDNDAHTSLREDADVEDHDAKGRGDAKDETAEVQTRVNGARVTDGSDKEDCVGQNGEGESCECEDCSADPITTPARRIYRRDSKCCRTRGDDGCGSYRIAARKSHVGVQQE